MREAAKGCDLNLWNRSVEFSRLCCTELLPAALLSSSDWKTFAIPRAEIHRHCGLQLVILLPTVADEIRFPGNMRYRDEGRTIPCRFGRFALVTRAALAE